MVKLLHIQFSSAATSLLSRTLDMCIFEYPNYCMKTIKAYIVLLVLYTNIQTKQIFLYKLYCHLAIKISTKTKIKYS